MSEPYRILVPLDGSELSERVFPWLRLLSKAIPLCEIELLRSFELPATIYLIPELAVPATALLTNNELTEAIKSYLEDKVSQLGLERVTSTVTMADPATEILSRGDSTDMIVMASHGRGGLGRWLMGSVTTKVTRGTSVPVLVVSAKCIANPAEKSVQIKKILSAFDGSEASQRAALKAAKLAKLFDAKLYLYQGLGLVALPSTVVMEANEAALKLAYEEMLLFAQQLNEVEVQVETREVTTKTGIVEYAEEVDADLIVMGSHGKSGLERWMLGSETEHVLHYAHCPVLITH